MLSLEKELVNTIPSYPKGYDITGSTKVTYRLFRRITASCLCINFGSFFQSRRSLVCWCISAWLRLTLSCGCRITHAGSQTRSLQYYAMRVELTSIAHQGSWFTVMSQLPFYVNTLSVGVSRETMGRHETRRRASYPRYLDCRYSVR
jgi:hypothetical protein